MAETLSIFNNYCLLIPPGACSLTHWGRVTHICDSKQTIIGSDNGLSPGRRQAIIWTNAGILLIGPLGTNFNEILIEIHAFSFKEMHLKMSSGKWRPSCLGPNVLTEISWRSIAIRPKLQDVITHPYLNPMVVWISSHWNAGVDKQLSLMVYPQFIIHAINSMLV